ncbi:MAG: DUF4349 domain-containing protein [Oscillospiraceae bacterium]|nr:DUF4349 domain-containing protein [Oscillospiraceae bacterium]
MKQKRQIALSLVFAFCICLFTACGSSSANTADFAYGKQTANSESATAERADDGYAPYESATGAAQTKIEDTNRKIIRNATIDLEAKLYDDTLSAIYEAVSANAGYVASSDSYGNETYEYGRSANLVLRIPSGNYNAFLTAVKETGNVTHLSEGTEDVTETYYDLEARLKTLSIQEERLLALLQKAESLEDIIKLEEQLSEVRYQIESAQGKLKLYDNQIDYATITVNVQEVKNITISKPNFLQRLQNSFKGSFAMACEVFENLLFVVIYLLPYAIIMGIFVWIIIALVKKHDKKQRALKHNLPQPPQDKTEK